MKNKLTFKVWLTSVIIAAGMFNGFTESVAQGFSLDDVAIGAKVGVNFNQFSQPGTAVGGSAGVFARSQVLDFLQVQAELVYSLQGGGRMEYSRDFNLNLGNGSGGSLDGPIDFVQYINRNVMLHVVELPITARLGIPELNDGAIVPRLIVGGSYSFNFVAMEANDKIINFVDGTRGLVSNTYDNVSLNYFPHNFSALIGIALDFNLAEEKVFTMEFRYRRGFSNLNQVETIITELTDKLYSSGFSINFSYRIF